MKFWAGQIRGENTVARHLTIHYTGEAAVRALIATVVCCWMSGHTFAQQEVSAGGLYGGASQKFAVCYVTFLAHNGVFPVSLLFPISGIFDQGGNPAVSLGTNCNQSFSVKQTCVMGALIENDRSYSCFAFGSPGSNLTGTLDLRDASGQPIAHAPLVVPTVPGAEFASAGGLYGGASQKFAVCYVTFIGVFPGFLGFPISGIFDRGGNPAVSLGNNCNQSHAVKQTCAMAASIENDRSYSCFAFTSGNSNLTGTLDLRDATGQPIAHAPLLPEPPVPVPVTQ